MSRLTDLANALEAKGIPVYGVGADRSVDYKPAATAAQRTQGDALAASWDMGARVRRPLAAILADLNALTAAQKNAVGADLFAAVPVGQQKWAQDNGLSAPALLLGYQVTQLVTLSAADKTAMKIAAAALYVWDYPAYLVNPAFDVSISVPGDMPAP